MYPSLISGTGVVSVILILFLVLLHNENNILKQEKLDAVINTVNELKYEKQQIEISKRQLQEANKELLQELANARNNPIIITKEIPVPVNLDNSNNSWLIGTTIILFIILMSVGLFILFKYYVFKKKKKNMEIYNKYLENKMIVSVDGLRITDKRIKVDG